ncbi:MAG TPA: helix-turn-helix domain-containing protein, partial [Pirellulaceae bacterium]|nr:helix-turn-helix domain-containing protein [Pirellulaceae bacterium]
RDLPREIMSRSVTDSSAIFSDTDDLSSIERAKVIEVLRRESGNKTRAAKTLGIDRRKLYRLVEKYDIKSSEVAATHG